MQTFFALPAGPVQPVQREWVQPVRRRMRDAWD
jgi:hypothetical protein